MPRDQWKRANERAAYGPAKADYSGGKRRKNKKTPKCPLCHQRMVLRRNRYDGSTFYGCRSWPTCAGTQPIEQA